MRLLDNAQIVSGFVPVDMQTASNPGDVVSLKNYNHLTVILFKGIGTDGQDPVLTFEQGTDVAFGTNKVLANIDEFWQKQATDLTTVGTFTRVTQTASQTVTLDGTSAQSQGVYVFEIDATDLDVDGGYDCVRVTVADVGGNAQLGCLLYILTEPRYAAETMPSAIVD